MAIGDAAQSAGLQVFAATQDARLGYQNDNVRGDELAGHIISGTHSWGKITGKPLLYTKAETDSRIDAAKSTAIDFTLNHLEQAVINLESPSSDARADGVSSSAYQRSAGTDRVPMYMNAQMQITRNTSSQRYKEDIQDAGIDPASVLALRPVTFVRKDDQSGERELGLIAEEVQQTGLEDLVVYYGGQIDGVRYDVLAVALLEVIKNQEARIAALEAGVNDAA